MKLSLFAKLVPFYLILISIFVYWVYSHNTQAKHIDIPDIETNNIFVLSNPQEIFIPALGLKIEIGEGNYNAINKTWNVSSTKAQYIAISDLPNPYYGNTVIYAHNTNNLFGQTSRLVTGDSVIIVTQNNNHIEYKLINTKLVSPSDVSVLDSSEKPKLTLITCWGLLNEKRKIMEFQFEKII